MKVTLFLNTDDKRVVRKKPKKLGDSIDCQIKENCSIENPVIVILKKSTHEWASCNYMYIDIFNRYYNAKITVGTAGEIIIEGEVDPLQSFKNYILQLNCMILRQEFISSPYFQDNALAQRVNRKYIYRHVGNLPDAQTNVLTVDGGKFI